MPTILDSLNSALHSAMEEDDRVCVIGEDILDPYGGAFKVTRGLSTRFPDRIFTTPISEAAIVGLGTGLALRGMRPVVEIMFGDFLTLTADQLVNHASKFRWMYNDYVEVPLVVRTPMGGGRGYGPTHSQSLEKMFLGIPGLRVVAVNSLIDPGTMLKSAIASKDPLLFIEHKLLYPRPILQEGVGELKDYRVSIKEGEFPDALLQLGFPHRPHVTIATYGYCFELVRKAALTVLMERELFCEIVLISQLSPFRIDTMMDSLRRSGKLLTVEEGGITSGWGAEVLARLGESSLRSNTSLRRVAALDLPVANARSLEDAILPSKDAIIRTILEMI